ncbi:AT-rich interactive domain-containing protein 5A [Etheostoma cragini]|uniref:AT-rich interactive domain-containing protein 5A n=1 Tax=Etheostoma cragini TaxID=417921 RepID=UPI00155E3A8A|nr:AT-rich interactive domain-containing protein 5A [Etheostoma cragini]
MKQKTDTRATGEKLSFPESLAAVRAGQPMKLMCGDNFLFRDVKLKKAPHELLSPNTVPRRREDTQLLQMAQEGQGETSQHTASSDEDKGTGTQVRTLNHYLQLLQTRVVTYVHSFTQVTARRLWKKVYDELGGSPGSTSAATCTRRHYEKLVLAFERHLKGEDDRPLPPSKPRKPYKRNMDAKVTKAKRKRTPSDMDVDSEMEILSQRSPEAACQSDAAMHPHPALWAPPSDRLPPDVSQPNRAAAALCTSVYAHLVPVPTSSPWTAHVPPAAGEVISPLEKKKRVAQASLNLPPSPHSEDKERPSVIHCSPSPARASSSQNCNSSNSSPLPLSPSSSRSPSPYSVSSEDGPEETKDKPASDSELPLKCSSSGKTTSSSEERKFASCSQKSKDPAGQSKNVRSQSADSIKLQIEGSAWMPIHKGSVKYAPHPFHLPSSLALRSDWAPTSTSSFTKVVPKSVQLLRPAPIRPAYKTPQGRLLQQDDSLACAKKLSNMAPWLYPTEKRDKSRTMQPKGPSTQQQQSLAHSAANLPASCVHQSCDKSGRDSRHQPLLHPSFLPNRMRLPQSQLTYRHVPVSPAHSALIGSEVYPYPYSIPLLNPQTCYTLPAVHPVYFHKL